MDESVSKSYQFNSENTLESSSVLQIIRLNGRDDNCLHYINGEEVLILPSKASGKDGNLDASSKVKFQSIVRYDWEHTYYYGNLVISHINKTHFAYILKSKSGGVVRVANKETNQRALLKDFRGAVVDISFAAIEDRVVLGVVDSVGRLYVYELHENQHDGKLVQELLLQSNVSTEQESKFHRLVWCSYIKEGPPTTPSSPSSSPPSSPEPPIDDSLMLLLTHDHEAELWHVDLICRSKVGTVVNPATLSTGYYKISSHHKPIVDAAFSPDGTAVATASMDGEVKFFQINISDSEVLKLVHQWRPHEGRPVSFMHFLDDHQNKNPEVQLWKFVVTGSSSSGELKLWNCQMWSCIQTLYFHPSLPHPSISHSTHPSTYPSIPHSNFNDSHISKNSRDDVSNCNNNNNSKISYNNKNNNNDDNGDDDDGANVDGDNEVDDDDDDETSLGRAVEFKCSGADDDDDSSFAPRDTLSKEVNGQLNTTSQHLDDATNNRSININNNNNKNSSNNTNDRNGDDDDDDDLVESVCMKVKFDLSSSYLIMSDINRQVIYILHLSKDLKADKVSFCMLGEFLLNQSCLSFDIGDISLVMKDDLDNNEDSDGSCGSAGGGQVMSVFLYTVHPKCLQSLQVHYALADVVTPAADAADHSAASQENKSEKQLSPKPLLPSQPVNQTFLDQSEIAHFLPTFPAHPPNLSSTSFPEAPFRLLPTDFLFKKKHADENKNGPEGGVVLHNGDVVGECGDKVVQGFSTQENKNDDGEDGEENGGGDDGGVEGGGGGEDGEGVEARGLVEGADRDRPDGGSRVRMVPAGTTTTNNPLNTSGSRRFFDREGDGVCDGGDGSSDASSASQEVTEIFEHVVDDDDDNDDDGGGDDDDDDRNATDHAKTNKEDENDDDKKGGGDDDDDEEEEEGQADFESIDYQIARKFLFVIILLFPFLILL